MFHPPPQDLRFNSTGQLQTTNVDDGLTSLTWLQNLNLCMTRFGAPTPPTPPASPHRSVTSQGNLYSNQSNQSKQGSQNRIPRIDPRAVLDASVRKMQQNPSCALSSQVKPKVEAEEKLQAPVGEECDLATACVDYRTDASVKPPFSYASLICMAMKANRNKMTLNSIYKWIRENFVYYQHADRSWQNSIRHNLSLNKCFVKIARTKEEPGKGGFWRLDPVFAETLVDGVFKKRRLQRPTGVSNYRRKTKKRNPAKRGQKESFGLEHGEMEQSLDSRSLMIHETPPNSAESYASFPEPRPVPETVELVNAVSSIDPPLEVAGNHYSVSFHPSNGVGNFGDETCVHTVAPNAMIGPENMDICWNTILTDTDLEFANPVNYSCQVVQHESSSTTCHCDECIVGNLMTNFIP